MKRWHRFLKVATLATCGGAMWMWGAGSCLPYNFYSNLLGDAVISTAVSTVSALVAGSLVGGQQ
jgi:hypothetical protein